MLMKTALEMLVAADEGLRLMLARRVFSRK